MDAKTYCLNCIHKDVCGWYPKDWCTSFMPAFPVEPLTDKEQRIFLAAIGREKKVCEKVDAEMTREPYEDSLVRVCREIERKVKKALWTN